LLLSQILTWASNHFLGASTFMTLLSAVTIFFITVGIVGLGVGLGAAFPKFKFENVTQIAGSAGGLIYMIAASTFVAAVLFVEAFPAYLYLSAQFRGVPLDSRMLVIIGGTTTIVIALNIVAVWLPMRWGGRRLAAMEL
jgi:ABC-2 type transport system permease protein